MDQPDFKITYCPPGYAYGYDGRGGWGGESSELQQVWNDQSSLNKRYVRELSQPLVRELKGQRVGVVERELKALTVGTERFVPGRNISGPRNMSNYYRKAIDLDIKISARSVDGGIILTRLS